jgi:hydroxymethylbilane synthase
MNARLQGGCQVPIAGFAEIDKDILLLRGLVGETDGSNIIRGDIAGPLANAEEMGVALAEDLLSRGADRILESLYAGQRA